MGLVRPGLLGFDHGMGFVGLQFKGLGFVGLGIMRLWVLLILILSGHAVWLLRPRDVSLLGMNGRTRVPCV